LIDVPAPVPAPAPAPAEAAADEEADEDDDEEDFEGYRAAVVLFACCVGTYAAFCCPGIPISYDTAGDFEDSLFAD